MISKTAQAVVQAMKSKEYLRNTQIALLDYEKNPTPEKADTILREHVIPTMIMLGNKKPGKHPLSSVDYFRK